MACSYANGWGIRWDRQNKNRGDEKNIFETNATALSSCFLFYIFPLIWNTFPTLIEGQMSTFYIRINLGDVIL